MPLRYKNVRTKESNFYFIFFIYLKAFALFCGIGIQNIIMYEKVVRSMHMQQVALDVLSYHASAKHEEVKQLMVFIHFIKKI